MISIRQFNYDSFIKTLNIKKFFLTKVYLTLIFQIFIAYVVLMYAENKNINLSRIQIICLVISLFAIIILIHYVQSPILKFIIFCIFSGVIGLMFSIKVDLKNGEDYDIIKKAFVTTCAIFIYMTLFGFFASFMGARISPLISMVLLFSLLILIIVMFILSITNKYSLYYKLIAGIIIFLFSLFIIYDTVSILDRNYYGDFISASLDYFLDFINIFSALLNLE